MRWVLLGLAFLALPVGTFAAEPVPATAREWRVAELIGRPVEDRVGKKVGTVADVVIGTDQRLSSVVVALRDEGAAPLVEVPWRMASWGLSGDAVSLPMDVSDVVALRRGIDQFRAPRVNQWLGRDLLGSEVVDPSHRRIGSVTSVVIGPGGAISRYSVNKHDDGQEFSLTAAQVHLNPRLGIIEIAQSPAER